MQNIPDFSIHENNYQPPRYLGGHFLISETELMDPNFHKTVVLMIDHNDDGAFGLVVNRVSTSVLSNVLEVFQDNPAGDLPVYIGGPVQQYFLFVLHSGLPDGNRSSQAQEPLPGVIFETDFDLLSDFFMHTWPDLEPEHRPVVHLFAGYSGWGPGQLENELERSSWIVLPGSSDLVFSPKPEESWENALRKKGGLYWVAAETGYKPSMN
ncbi:MAG: YqgE/AlgH family protein [Spirochaetales bacterium]|nr:YqgE/AlgH family protein [Spirochaetales bacterium]MCF7939115.1 YqgE/AlgH family protein [Spirochaetales bacterium]